MTGVKIAAVQEADKADVDKAVKVGGAEAGSIEIKKLNKKEQSDHEDCVELNKSVKLTQQ